MEGTATPAPSGLTDVLRFVRRETYSLDEHSNDPYARGWIHAMQHVERWLVRGEQEQRTIQGLRSLRDSTFQPGVLFEAVSVFGGGE